MPGPDPSQSPWANMMFGSQPGSGPVQAPPAVTQSPYPTFPNSGGLGSMGGFENKNIAPNGFQSNQIMQPQGQSMQPDPQLGTQSNPWSMIQQMMNNPNAYK